MLATTIALMLGVQAIQTPHPDNPCFNYPDDFGRTTWINKLADKCNTSCESEWSKTPQPCWYGRSVNCPCVWATLMPNYSNCLDVIENEYRSNLCEKCWPLMDPNNDGDISDGNLAQYNHCVGWAWAYGQTHAGICLSSQDIESCCRRNGYVDCP